MKRFFFSLIHKYRKNVFNAFLTSYKTNNKKILKLKIEKCEKSIINLFFLRLVLKNSIKNMQFNI